MTYCAQAYPFSAMEQYMPLMQKSSSVPSWYSGNLQQKQQQMQGGVLYNVDGQPISFNPCQYSCSLNHLQQAKPVYWQVGQKYTTLGGVVSAPAYYLQCGGSITRTGATAY